MSSPFAALSKLPPEAALKLKQWLEANASAPKGEVLLPDAFRDSGIRDELPRELRRAVLATDLVYFELTNPEYLKQALSSLEEALQTHVAHGPRLELDGLRASSFGSSSASALKVARPNQPPVPSWDTSLLEVGDTPSVSLGSKRPQVELTSFGPQTQGASVLVGALNDGGAFQKLVTALPLSRGDRHPEGTRSFAGKVRGFPGRIIRFSGPGVVRSYKAKTGGSEARVQIDAPEPKKPVSSTHLQGMGTMRVDHDGKLWSVHNRGPFGAYPLDELEQKVKNTETYGARYGVAVEAAFQHVGLGVGGLAYSVPADVVNPSELLRMDLGQSTGALGGLYGASVQAFLAEARRMHDEGYVHLQLHPGNWFVQPSPGGPRPVITDWSTVTKLDELASPSVLQKKQAEPMNPEVQERLEGLSPSQKLRVLDLHNAFSAAALVLDSGFTPSLAEGRDFGLSYSSLSPTVDMVRFAVRMHVRAVAGYLGREASGEALAKLEEKMWSALEVSVFRLGDLTSGHANLLEFTRDHDRPSYGLGPGFSLLQLELARAMVSAPKETTVDDVITVARSRLQNAKA